VGRSGSRCTICRIGGLTVSTLVTLVLVPVVYSIFVKDVI
jgi:multidrug efflux pump subunit AcrB